MSKSVLVIFITVFTLSTIQVSQAEDYLPPPLNVLPEVVDSMNVFGIAVRYTLGKNGGLIIDKIQATSPFAQIGLQEGDEIIFIAGSPVKNQVELGKKLREMKNKGGEYQIVVADVNTGVIFTFWIGV